MTQEEVFYTKEPYDKVLSARTVIETKKSYANDFIRFDRWIGGIHPKDVSEEKLHDFIQWMVDEKYAARTIVREMSTLGLLYQSLSKQKVIEADRTINAFDLFRIEPSKRKPKALSKLQREHLVKSLKWDTDEHEHCSLAMSVGLWMGLRRAEVWRLKWTDINFRDETLYTIGKGSKEATLQIPSILMALFTKYKKEDGYVIGKHSLSVFQWWTEKMVREWCGWDKDVIFSFHVLRHSFCTALAEAGVDPNTIMSLARHSSFDTTRRYIKDDVVNQKKVLNGVFN